MRILIGLVFILPLMCIAQCPAPGDLTFTNQSEIDNFIINYPNCNQIDGSVTFNGITISDLSPFNQIEAIQGSLIISGTSINDSFHLNNLISITGSLNILYNLQIQDVSGFNNLVSVGLNVWLEGNDALLNLNGFDSLSTIGKDFQVDFNANITSFDGLNSLTSINDRLIVYNNLMLNSITGLQNLTQVSNGIYFSDNISLNSLNGLQNIDFSSISQLSLFSMDNLSDCNYLNICDYINNGGNSSIFNNTFGCDNAQEILNSCAGTLSINPTEKLELKVFPNPFRDNLYLNSDKPYSYVLYDIQGKNVKMGELSKDGISLIDLDSGIYFLKLAHTLSPIKIIKIK